MSTNVQKPIDRVVDVAASGIRQVSPLLPLLGTGQCESLVSSALERGLLYAAATPMSIFGSLGIAKAGFIVLWSSIDCRWFPGPSLLRNAGFIPPGIGTLLVHVDDNNRHLYVAEDKLRRILSKKRIESVDVNFLSKDLLLWNVRLIVATLLLSAFGFLPYVSPIVRFLPDQPFYMRWLYPTLRIVGCDIVAITIQFIFQLRILEETYSRIRFMATDSYLKDHGKSVPSLLDPNENSKTVLKELRRHSRSKAGSDDRLPVCILDGLGKISSFVSPPYSEGCNTCDEQPLPRNSQPDPISSAEQGLDEPLLRGPAQPSVVHTIATRFLLLAFQLILSFGLILAVVGYIGCFSVVQASPSEDTRGVLVWLVCEAALAVLRILVWAANPKWDDAKSPIALEKVATTKGDNKKTSSYGIGWMLSSVTADDVHALIVGINKFGEASTFRDLNECVPDARRVASYLKDTLLVPRDQITTLYNSEATKERITQALRDLSQKASVAPDAPIIIYLASHTGVRHIEGTDKKEMYLVPHCGAEKDARISYDSIVDMIGHIAENKTDNIILILDTCHAGAMGKNEKFDNASSHSRGHRHTHPGQSRGTDLEELESSEKVESESVSSHGGSSADPSDEDQHNTLSEARGLILKRRLINGGLSIEL
ncbi:hypothetical protein MD484_g7052, partial [Candolleomyces efflorescens]